MPINEIDFLRDDVGEWLLFVIIPLLALSGLKAGELIRAGWRKTARAVATRFLIGLLFAAPISGLLMIWQRRPPQYFTKLRLESDQVVLGFRRPEPEKIIPLANIWSVQIVKSGSKSRSCRRVCIQTVAGTHRSYGFHQLNEDEIAVMDGCARSLAQL